MEAPRFLLPTLPTIAFCIGEEERGGRCQRGEAHTRKRAGQYAARGRLGAEQDKVLLWRVLEDTKPYRQRPFPLCSHTQPAQLHFTPRQIQFLMKSCLPNTPPAAALFLYSDLYQERCRDYATMVADECEGEVNKDAAGTISRLLLHS